MVKGKKGGKTQASNPNLLTEVDKTFYELQITDLNRKLARLREKNDELELKNEELIEQKDTLKEDNNDIIMYLKRALQEKTDEVYMLEDKIRVQEKVKKNDIEELELKIAEMEVEYNNMHDKLTSESRLLEGKLNNLYELAQERDELMEKFERQEQEKALQEAKHSREIYEIERKFIIARAEMRKDMEDKLSELAVAFQDATDLRIAATTKRVIRENIACNNEINILLETQQTVFNENANLKKKEGTMRRQNQLHAAETVLAVNKTKIQAKLIERLTDRNASLTDDLKKYKHFELELAESRKQLRQMEEKNSNCEYKLRLLEQNLHNARCQRMAIQTDFLYLRDEKDRMNDLLREAVNCVKEAFIVSSEEDIMLQSDKQEKLLATLHALLSSAKDETIKRPSLESIDSVKDVYAVGDLGFVPKKVEVRSKLPVKQNMESQTTESFEEYVRTGAVQEKEIKYYGYGEEQSLVGEEAEEEEEEEVEKRKSILFFDEETLVGEESEDSGGHDLFGQLEDDQPEVVEETEKRTVASKSSKELPVEEAGPQEEGEVTPAAEEEQVAPSAEESAAAEAAPPTEDPA